MKAFSKILIAVLTFFGMVSAPLVNPVYAEDDTEESSESSWLQMAPVSQRVVLRPGTEIDYATVITNVGSQAYEFHVYAAPYTVLDEDYNISFSNETNRSQIVRWIKFIADDGSLVDTYTSTVAAGEQKAVNYRIVVPEDIPEGGQYATIFAQTDAESGSNSVTSGSSLKTVSRVGMVVYGHTTGETREAAEISEYKVPGFLFSGPVTVSSLVKNDGNTDFGASYSLKVESIIGNELYSATEDYNILPDTSRRETLSWDNTQLMGIFKVTYRVEALDQVREETRMIVILPLYMLIIMIALLTIFIIWIIMLIRKRRERKSRLVV